MLNNKPTTSLQQQSTRARRLLPSIQKSTPMSPSATGSMRADKYYLLKSGGKVYDPDTGRMNEHIEEEQVDLDTYRTAAERAEIGSILGHRYHGRRINDEFELFQWNSGKETPGLRDSLEARGFEVRTYVPESKQKKFPKATYEGVLGKDSGSAPCEDKYLNAMNDAMTRLKKDENTCIDHAILLDADKADRKVIVAAKFRKNDFYDFYYGANPSPTLEVYGMELRIIGAYEFGEAHFKDLDQHAISFFKPKKDGGGLGVEVVFYDLGLEREEAEQRARNAAKKQAKKERRQATIPADHALGADAAQDDAAVKARQRDKAKAKKKAQKERKKTEAIAAGQEAKGTLVASREEKLNGVHEDEEDNDNDNDNGNNRTVRISLAGICDPQIIIYTENGRRMCRHGGQAHDLRTLQEDSGFAVKARTAAGTEEASSRSKTPDGDGNGDGSGDDSPEEIGKLHIVHVLREQDVDRAMREARGPVLLAAEAGNKERGN